MRKTRNNIWTILAALSLLVVLSRAPAAQFSPPQDNGELQTPFDTVKGDLAAGRTSSAAARIDSLLGSHGDDMVSWGDTGLISVATLLERVAADDQTGLRDAYAKQFDPAARAALQAVQRSAHAEPGAFYAVARRYPFTATAIDALGLAGDRAAQLGDWPGAKEYYREALAAGLKPDEPMRRRIDALNAAVPLPAPAKANLLHVTPGYEGPILFNAPWYSNPVASIQERFFPLQSGQIVFFATFKRVLAFQSTGGLLWSYPLTEVSTDPRFRVNPSPYRNKRSDGAAAANASWGNDDGTFWGVKALSTAGEAQVVIARGPVPSGTIGLIALRASDGQALWSTVDQDSTARLTFCPDPTICGRCVYATALDGIGPQASLLLVALDVSTGAELWRTNLGLMGSVQPHHRRQTPDDGAESPYCEPAGITVAGDQLILTPNVGYVICLGRFDGKVRWMCGYPRAKVHGMDRPAIAGHRYDNHPYLVGTTVIAAAQDAASAVGLDAGSGTILWQSPALVDETLIGTAGATAVFAGKTVSTYEAKTGQSRWTYRAEHSEIVGPPVIAGSFIFVPTRAGPVSIAADSGLVSGDPQALTNLDKLFTEEAIKIALVSDGAMEGFGYAGQKK